MPAARQQTHIRTVTETMDFLIFHPSNKNKVAEERLGTRYPREEKGLEEDISRSFPAFFVNGLRYEFWASDGFWY
jgi:hypothetical protein